MADWTDMASERTQAELDSILQKRRQDARKAASPTHCVDCEDEIPPQRRALGGMIRCISCQEDHELRSSAYR